MPRRVQPVPPIFQPEIAARAIVWAATHRRRDVWVGWPAIKAIISSRLFAGLGDRLAAERAWEGQETAEPDDSLRDNQFAPVPGPFGARGRFDRRARQAMSALWVVQHRVAVGSALVAAALILFFLGVP
jgi:hypothetical protein